MDKLRAMEYFVRTVETGSMSAAARLLEVSPPAVTKMLAALQAELGVALLRRDARRLLLTPDGDRYFKLCARLLESLRASEAQLQAGRGQPRGRLVVGVSRVALAHALAPHLPRFCAEHPALELDLRAVNFAHEPGAGVCDVLVLIGWQQNVDWQARQVARGRHVVVASPQYWGERGEPADPADLARHACIAYRVPRGVAVDRWRFSRGIEQRTVEFNPRLIVEDRDSLVQAVLLGMGVHFGNDLTLLPWLRDGRLRMALSDWIGLDAPPVNVMWRRGARASAAVRAFVDFSTGVWAGLMRERDAYGPADTTGMPDWFRSRQSGRLSERPGPRARRLSRASGDAS